MLVDRNNNMEKKGKCHWVSGGGCVLASLKNFFFLCFLPYVLDLLLGSLSLPLFFVEEELVGNAPTDSQSVYTASVCGSLVIVSLWGYLYRSSSEHCCVCICLLDYRH